MVWQAIWKVARRHVRLSPHPSGAASVPARIRPGKTAQFSYELMTSAGLIISKQVSRYLPAYLPDVDHLQADKNRYVDPSFTRHYLRNAILNRQRSEVD